MPNTLYKLEEITKEYTIFEDNQVLTKKQLNEVVDYFEDQTRMTRTLLLGVGLVCGLEVSHSASNNNITIGAGPSVTTDGDLLKIKAKTVFSNYKKYDDSNAKYLPFWPGGNQIPLWKLYTGKEDPPVEQLKGLKIFDTDATPIGQVAVILYLEFFPKDPDTCTTIDCDNLGARQIARQHVLLIRKTDLDNIIQNHDSIFAQYGNDSIASKMHAWHMPRVVFSTSNTKTFNQIFNAYAQTLKNLANNLVNQLISLYDTYEKILDPESTIDTAIWKNRIEALLLDDITNSGLGIQYLFDAVKDIADTYNELLKSIRTLCSICCPSIDSFPKHIMLSEVVKGQQTDAPEYRHKFYPTPIHEHNKGISEIKILLQRLNTLILDFVDPTKGQSKIRITPSYLKCAVLGEKAIPYYYKPGKTHLVWNHQKRKSGTVDENLSYHSEKYSTKEFVLNPLKFDFDEKDFLRIEGHINQDVNAALKEIQGQKETHGLAFDVVALRLNNLFEDIDYTDYKCHFEDLEVLLNAWISELNCLWKDVAGFFSKFSIRQEAVHEDYKTIHMAGADALTENVIVTGLDQKSAGAYFSQAYKSNPVVVDHVSTTKDSIGELFLQVNADQPVGCPADLKDTIVSKVSDAATTAGWKAESIEVAINYPAYVISNAHVLAYDQPEGILDLNEDLIKAFAKRLAALCKRTNTFRNYASAYFKSPNYAAKGYESQYLYLLDKVTDGCCAAAKLKELFKEILKRKQDIIKQTLFSEYVKNHPGLEHTGGVPIGGTFIMVYEDNAPKSNFFEKKAFSSGRSTKADEHRFMREISRADFPVEREIGRRNVFLGEVDEKAFGLEEVVVVGGQSIPKFTVVADFSLPYMCCSDCPPMSFIIPNVKVRLRIPDHICLDEETKPVEFLVEPVDGEVTADQGGEAIVKIDGRPYFDAAKLPATLRGKQIRFFVNGQETDAMTVVYRRPHPAFEFLIKVIDVEKRVAIVDFQNFTEEIAGENISYKWDFGDTKTSTERSPRHHYELPVNEKNIVEVVLFASNGPCSKKSEPVIIEFGQINEIDPGDNIRRNAELIFSRYGFELDQNRELLFETQELYKMVVGEMEATLIGENNLILERISKVSDRTHVSLRRQNPPKEQVLLGQLLLDQFYLAMEILRNQKKDIVKFVTGNAGPQTVTFKFLNGMGGKLKNAKARVPEFNHDGAITEYFETYAKAISADRPILRSIVERALTGLQS